MQYTDHCPNCDVQLTVVENTNNYAILYKGNAVGEHCPICKVRLIVGEDGLEIITRDMRKDDE